MCRASADAGTATRSHSCTPHFCTCCNQSAYVRAAYNRADLCGSYKRPDVRSKSNYRTDDCSYIRRRRPKTRRYGHHGNLARAG